VIVHVAPEQTGVGLAEIASAFSACKETELRSVATKVKIMNRAVNR